MGADGMSAVDINKAVAETIAEQTTDILACAHDETVLAQETAASVIAAAETTVLATKINSIEERLNTWQTNDASATILPLLTEIRSELQELKNNMAEMLDLLTEFEPEPEPELETPPSTPQIIAPEAMRNSPQPDAPSEKQAPANQRKNRLI
jgi:hypothetical protein